MSEFCHPHCPSRQCNPKPHPQVTLEMLMRGASFRSACEASLISVFHCRISHKTYSPSYFSAAVKLQGFPGGLVGKESTCNVGATGDTSLIPGAERFPGGRNSNLPQDSYLGNPMDREAWRATVHGVTKELDTT